MSQNAERARAIKQIRTLSEQTVDRGQSEAHANMAMDRIAKLLVTFDLTMDEVMLGAEGCVTSKFSTGGTKRRPIIGVSCAIAGFTDTKTWREKQGTQVKLDKDGNVSYYRNAAGRLRTHKVPGDTKIAFFGLESDVQMALHVADVIQKAIDYELAQFKKTDTYKSSRLKLSLSASFTESMGRRIGRRLGEMKAKMVQEVRTARPGETDLVVVKSRKIEDEFKKTGTKLVTSNFRSGTTYNAGSAAGYEAGGKVNLNRPLANGDRGQLLLA